MISGSVEQQSVLQNFVAACQADERVIAAFLGGSFASDKADEYSDLDLYIVTTDQSYNQFFAERHSFMMRLGQTVFEEDFNQFGFDMIIFTFADGVEGELALAPESNFEHIHGGHYRVLLDKTGLLADRSFPLLAPTAVQQVAALRRLIYWFWEDVSNFIKSLNRRHLWLAYSSLDQMRRKTVNLAHIQHDFSAEPGGYAGVEHDLSAEQKQQLEATFCTLEPSALLAAADTITSIYKQLAPPLAASHGIEYPAGVEDVLRLRMAKLRDATG